MITIVGQDVIPAGFSMPEFDRERETVYLEFCGVNASGRGWKSKALAWESTTAGTLLFGWRRDVWSRRTYTDRDGGQFRQRPV